MSTVVRAQRILRVAALVAIAVAPGSVKRLLYRYLFHYEIDRSATIKICFIDAQRVSLGAHSYLGHFTVIRNLPELVVGEYAEIGQWNWITCGELFTTGESKLPPPKKQGLFVGRHAAITSRHYIDCAGGVVVGAFATVAGVRSTILTHQINVDGNQECLPVSIGEYCYVGSNVTFVPGAKVADRCMVGAGALVAGSLADPDALYVGVPARFSRTLDGGAYFSRAVGRVR